MPALYKLGESLLLESIEQSKKGKGLDNISLNQSMQILAKGYQREGNRDAAEATVRDISNYFSSLPLKEHVKEQIRRQSATLLAKE